MRVVAGRAPWTQLETNGTLGCCGASTALRAFRMSLLRQRQPRRLVLQKARTNHVRLDHFADGRQKTGDVPACDPVSALGVVHGLELLGDESDVAAAAEH